MADHEPLSEEDGGDEMEVITAESFSDDDDDGLSEEEDELDSSILCGVCPNDGMYTCFAYM